MLPKKLKASELAKLRRNFINGARLKENVKKPEQSRAKALIYLRVDDALKQAIKEIMGIEGKSENALCVEILEEAIEKRLS